MEQQLLPMPPQAALSAFDINTPRMGRRYTERHSCRIDDSHAISRLHEVFLIIVIACSILTMVSLFQLSAIDHHGWAFFLNRCFGGLRYMMPLYLLYVGVVFYRHWKNESESGEALVLKLIGVTTLYLSIDAIFGSGALGQAITKSFFESRNGIEAWVIVLGLFTASLFLMTRLSCFEIASFVRQFALKFFLKNRHAFYPIDNSYRPERATQHYGAERESNLITYQQPFSHPHIHDPQSNQLINCLAHFGIRAVVSNKIPGPIITRFELHLAPGTKSSSICRHHKEIARSLCVQEVRVIEVIVGKSCIGIEIPNAHREIFSFNDLKDELENCREKLPLLLGRTTTGESKMVDLHTMPHLLVAGSTQSGKTNLLQSIIMSLTSRLSSEDLKLILIDPKCVAFSKWQDIPHLLMPVITDGNEAIQSLNWCVSEMDRRYQLMAMGNQKFPAIVVIIDEIADLILKHKNEIESTVQRLAQKARQSDIHLILATQRPTADVIIGHIKTNITTRIALSVPSRTDSRNIIDEGGAETLLGQGDMLFKSNDRFSERLHAAFVSDDEIRNHVLNLTTNENDFEVNSPASNIRFIDFKNNNDKQAIPQSQDQLYEMAVAYVKQIKKASTTSLQNHFKIGYQKASGIIDRLEAEGLIGKLNKNNEPREVFI